MTAWTMWNITCDVRACAEVYEAESVTRTAARQQARGAGWHRAGGADIGPECWHAGWRNGRDGWTVG